MGNLIKYELKGRSKLIIGGIIAFTIANLMLASNYIFKNPNSIQSDDKFLIISMLFMFLLSFIGIIVVIIDSVNLMRKDLFSDTGYLLFSIPQNGFSIVGAKLIVSLIEFVIYGFFTIGFVFIHGLLFTSIHSSEILTQIFNKGLPVIAENIPYIITFTLEALLSTIIFILSIYLSLTIAKSLLHSNKNGTIISFIVFIVVQIIISKLGNLINDLLGINYLSLTEFSKYSFVSVGFSLVMCAVLFISTAYLIDNKVEM